jgi:hypothetical protein
MRLTTRLHERLAERYTWIQFPKPDAYFHRPSLWRRYQLLSREQQGWVWFAIFWGTVIALSIIGNLFL